MIKFNELSDKEFYELLKERTTLTKYFKKNVFKIFRKHLINTYPKGVDLDKFIEDLPTGEEFNEMFGYLGES